MSFSVSTHQASHILISSSYLLKVSSKLIRFDDCNKKQEYEIPLIYSHREPSKGSKRKDNKRPKLKYIYS